MDSGQSQRHDLDPSNANELSQNKKYNENKATNMQGPCAHDRLGGERT